jgi:hypothetical protein
MSLESCPTCGYALAIVGGGCRHCASGNFERGPTNWRDPKFLLALGFATVLLAVLIYRIFLR